MNARKQVDRLGDAATSVISNAAGAVADPKTGLTKAKKGLVRPKRVLTLGVLITTLVLLRRRRRRS
jgi:hypothetical protein